MLLQDIQITSREHLSGWPELRVLKLLPRVLGLKGGDVGASVGVHGAVGQCVILLTLVTHAS